MRTDFGLAGITFRPVEEIGQLRPAGLCSVESEPTNKFDAGAIQIIWDGHFIGYVPGPKSKWPDVQAKVRDAMHGGEDYRIEVLDYSYCTGTGKSKEFNDNHEGVLGSVRLSLTTPDSEAVRPEPPKGDFDVLRSFNEPDVEVRFYPAIHQYWIEDVRLVSATGLVDKCYKPFDSKTIAGRCERSYGMSAVDIIAMWGANGDAASAFGTSVHLCMENYSRYGERALPKMPLLRDIVTSFPWEWFKDTVVKEELFITSAKRGVCGLCDRLVIRGDEHTVTDIKVNVDADVVDERKHKNLLFDEVPSSKIGHYITQMSIYVQMLEESGLGVNDKVCAHCFDGKWSHYSMPRISRVIDTIMG